MKARGARPGPSVISVTIVVTQQHVNYDCHMSHTSAARDHILNFRWRQGDPDLPPELARLHDLAALRDAITEEITETAVRAHDGGSSWADVGQALGISRQAAQKRFAAGSRLF